ncbi:MAG: type II secretion system F family protein [Lachnoclostridium sp.]
MFRRLYSRISVGSENRKYRSVILVAAATLLLSAGLLFFDLGASKKESETIRRNSYGEGSRTEEREITIGGDKVEEPLEITVGERQYTNDEMQKIFTHAIRKLDLLILGENKSLDEVRSDLELISKMPEEPIEIIWELDRYDVINRQGELQEDTIAEEAADNAGLEKEGILVNLKAFLRYTEDETKEALYETAVRIFPPLLTEEEEKVAKVLEKIRDEDNNKASEEIIKFPEEVEGEKVEYRRPVNSRGISILILGIAATGLTWCLIRRQGKKEDEKRKIQMVQDYPEIVNKLRLLLGAGMTIKNAWKKIVTDYEKKKEKCGERFAYEEMLITYREMQSGVTEAESYERFGRRCGIPSYLKLGAILSQNLRKGTRGVAEIMQMEAIQAFEERKALAKRRGEEASTKLLVPMFFMLGIVLVIVIVPAFLSIQI